MQIPHRWKADYSQLEQYVERRNKVIAPAPTKVETPCPTHLTFRFVNGKQALSRL